MKNSILWICEALAKTIAWAVFGAVAYFIMLFLIDHPWGAAFFSIAVAVITGILSDEYGWRK